MQPWFASIPLALHGASSPGGSGAESVERRPTSLIDWHVYYCDGGEEGERGREREGSGTYTYLAYSMIGRRLITIEIGSRVAIPTRVTAPARASTCIIKFTVIDLFADDRHHHHPRHPRALFSLRALGHTPSATRWFHDFPYLGRR